MRLFALAALAAIALIYPAAVSAAENDVTVPPTTLMRPAAGITSSPA